MVPMTLSANSPIIFAACDIGYARIHGPAFVTSAMQSGYTVHLHIIFPNSITTEDYGFIHELVATSTNLMKKQPHPAGRHSLGTTVEQLSYTRGEARLYYSCARFYAALALLKERQRPMFILDVDSIICQRITQPTLPVGLFFRDPLPGTVGWENEGTKVAAGLVYVAPEGFDFLQYATISMERGPQRWFMDQVALCAAARWWQLRGHTCPTLHHIHHFTNVDLDWDFNEGSAIWTGKGDRKYSNTKYLAKKQEFDNLYRAATV